MDVRLPDGTVVQNIPEGTSKADLAAKLKANGMNVPDAWLAPPTPVQKPPEDTSSGALDTLKRLAAGTYGNLEAIPALVSGAVAQPIAGLAGIASGGDADVVNKVQNAMTYQPRTDSGKATMQALDDTVGLIGKGADLAGQKTAEATGSPAIGAGVNTALQAIPMVLGAKFGPKTGGVRTTLNDTAQQSLKDAGSLGMVVTPSDAGMTGATAVAKGAESSGSLTKLQQAATKINAQKIVDGVKQDLGVAPNEQLTPARLAKVNDDADAAYKAVRNADQNQVPVVSANGVQAVGPTGAPLTKPAGPVQFNATYQNDVANIGADRANASFGSKIDPKVAELKADLGQVTSSSPSDLVSKINELRDDARGNLNSASADNATKALGRAQRQAADALESQLSDYLQNQPGIYQAMLKGRELKAKLGTLKDAYDSGSGNIDARIINRDLEAGVPLSGNMEKIGRIYGQFSKVMGDPTKAATSNHSIVDAGLMTQGALKAAGGDLTGIAEAGLGAARPLARKMALSDRYQAMLRSGMTPQSALSALAIPAAGASPLSQLQQSP